MKIELTATAGGYDDGDVNTNMTSNPTLESLVEARYSRRQTMFGGVAAMTTAVFGSSLLAGCGSDGQAPVVNVNAAGTSSSGKAVTLAGTATDADGTVASTVWTQVSGPAVTLAGANTANATFMAPSVSAATPLAFRFTATDEKGAVALGDSTITVNPAFLDFVAVPKNQNDIVTVPAGYTVTVLYRLGDPTNIATPAYVNDGSDTGFSARAGDHHDGMSFFGLAATGNAPDPNSNTRGVLAMNHENITQVYLHTNGPTGNAAGGVRPEGEALKEIEAHGVSVVEVVRSAAGVWSYVQGSSLNRRITPLTTMTFNGPVRGNVLNRTRFSTDGTQGRGTINNCANGYFPWATYATNEENWAGYFRRDTTDDAARGGPTAKSVVSLNRYGIGVAAGNRAGNYRWNTVVPANPADTTFARWNLNVQAGVADGTGDFRNEANQFGWVVEIDPYNAASVPRKRTALGRMNHEGCWSSNVVVGRRPAFYMGDDAQNEYLYKFVSNAPWVAADATAPDRLATGDKYLDAGILYVARFDATGQGVWLPLVFGQGPLTAANATYAFADQADVLINTRIAADLLGATRMDRPEWTAVNPRTGEMYVTMTNNSSRTQANADASNPRFYNDPRTTGAAQRGNPNGQIVRLRETGDTTEATTFQWDIYAFGAGADLDPTNINLSGLDATNDFSSPDGLWFARPSNASGLVTPVLWVQTDDGAYTDVTNCMMLAGMPGPVGDGAARTVTNTGTDGSTRTQATFVGRAPGVNLKRFLVGPIQCEITGVDTTPDGRSLFVNIQHPGENGTIAAISSSWPATQAGPVATPSRPRSATIVITKNDGGVVGL